MAQTHAELAARLLREAAAFFDVIGEQNAPLRDQMRVNASVFRRVADLVETEPTSTLSEEDSEEDEGEAGNVISGLFPS